MNQPTVIMKEFFNIVTPLFEYEPCEESINIEKSILQFLLQSYSCDSLFDECWKLVEDAESIQTVVDGTLMFICE